MTKTATPDDPIAGQQVTYTIVIGNRGPSDATGVTLTDTLPAGLDPDFVRPTQGTCSRDGRELSCALGVLPAGGAAQVVVTADVARSTPAPASRTRITAAEFDARPGNNSDEVTTRVRQPAPPLTADLSVRKTADLREVGVGSLLTYTITVRNDGPAAATGVEITDTLGGPAEVVGVDPDQGSCDTGLAIRCRLGDSVGAVARVRSPSACGHVRRARSPTASASPARASTPRRATTCKCSETGRQCCPAPPRRASGCRSRQPRRGPGRGQGPGPASCCARSARAPRAGCGCATGSRTHSCSSARPARACRRRPVLAGSAAPSGRPPDDTVTTPATGSATNTARARGADAQPMAPSDARAGSAGSTRLPRRTGLLLARPPARAARVVHARRRLAGARRAITPAAASGKMSAAETPVSSASAPIAGGPVKEPR